VLVPLLSTAAARAR